METGYYSIYEKVYVVYGNKGVIMNMKNGEIREQSLCVLYERVSTKKEEQTGCTYVWT